MSVRQQILVACLGFVAIVVTLGGLAQQHATRMAALAVGIYDNSFIGMSYVAQVREAFVHLAEESPSEGAPSSHPPRRVDVERVVVRLDVAVERAATDRTREAGRHTRALLLQLVDAPAEELAVRMARADQSITDLVKNFSADGLGTRDRAEASEADNFRQLLVETGIAICLAMGVGLFLGRHLSRPLVQLFHCIETLAAGNLDYEIAPELAHRRHEIGAVAGATIVFREAMRRNAQAGKDQFRAALSNMSQGLCMFDSADRLIVANSRMAEMLAMPAARFATGMTLENILGKTSDVSSARQADIDTMYSSIQHLKAAGVPADSFCELTDDRTLAANFVPVAGGGWLVTLEDITARRLAEAKITFMARHDALTGLPNRALFHDRLKEAVARSRRGEPCAVLYLDLDHFKAVNDTLGHPVGDALLREVTERLGQQVREVDTVARLGGDEFAIIQSKVDQPGGATALAKRLVEAVSQPYDFDGNQFIIGASIGIAIVPGDGQDPDELMKNADMALYRAKGDGRGRWRFFEPEMDALMQARRSLEMDIRRALAADEFELYYQPLMAIETRTVSGFEALLRWHHPERGMVPPSEFVPLAEEIGVIIPLGKWVLNRACADAATWPGGAKVAVNVSGVQFSCHTLVDDVAAALAASGLAPDRLELEITETVLITDTEAVLTVLRQLRDLGVGIAMDDFGTGYSSLSYLRRFPFSKVKIDQSFIRGLGTDRNSAAIIKAITDLCKTLGMSTLAEGVETEEQFRQLQDGSCGEAQGFLFSAPRPAAEVAAMCRRLSQPEWVGGMA